MTLICVLQALNQAKYRYSISEEMILYIYFHRDSVDFKLF